MRLKTKSRLESPMPAANPEQRILAVLALDHSFSTTQPCRVDPEDAESALTTLLDELKAALPQFKTECAADGLLRLQFEVATVTFCQQVTTGPVPSHC